MEIFRGYHAKARGEFVIESDCEPDNGKPYEHYRCDHEFAELIGWLRGKGVVSRTPPHTLRKEFGSQINARFGLVAAKECFAMRRLIESEINITGEKPDGALADDSHRSPSVAGHGHLFGGQID